MIDQLHRSSILGNKIQVSFRILPRRPTHKRVEDRYRCIFLKFRGFI